MQKFYCILLKNRNSFIYKIQMYWIAIPEVPKVLDIIDEYKTIQQKAEMFSWFKN
ncbi:hypothetical protein OCK74_00495 [Chitinophagaceae bacterium LB-8]|jgi:hypothetical protein|uniref:Uncharacterized protein n=1 Tax=Paraflavisolibacter caeni TaxID=2982496 RepID=A0A9X3B6Q7_9BACT|nr:hypothetical protein [Paraflavisolibacter caeni]MCU7547566.1 hypothetical protein [Paraflavisolibacter caeni]